MIDAGLYALLAADAGVSAITARIFQGDGPPDMTQLPCVAYSFVGGSSDPGLTTSGVLRQRVEINAMSTASEQASDLRNAIIKAVNGWQQQLTDGTNVVSTTLLNPGTDFVTEDRIFRRMCEFYVLYTLPS